MNEDIPTAPLVTVCMPVSRSVEDLRRALRSVIEQGVESLQVVVTDDSAGRLRPAVDELGDPRVEFYANPRSLGFAGNHMACLDRARGEFIGILHEDDVYLPGFLTETLEQFQRDQSLGVVMTDCWVEHEGMRRRRGVRLKEGRYATFLSEALRHDYYLPSTTLLRREVLANTRRWPDTQAADLFLFIDAARAGWPFYYVDKPLVVYQEHGNQISTNDLGLRDSLVAVFSAYSFPDSEEEDLRRYRLAWALVSRGGARLLRHEARDARADLRQARRVHARTLRWKRIALYAATLAPRVVTAAHPIWIRWRHMTGLARRHQYHH